MSMSQEATREYRKAKGQIDLLGRTEGPENIGWDYQGQIDDLWVWWARNISSHPAPERPKVKTKMEALDAVDMWKRNCDAYFRELTETSGEPKPANPPDQHNEQAKEAREQAGRKNRRMTVAEANQKAMKLAKGMRGVFFALSERQQAQKIGCAWETWSKTPLYAKARAKRPGGKAKTPKAPKVQSLTAKREAVTGEGDKDETLQTLIAEQEADKEPSPLESRPRKIHSRKKL